MKNFLRALKISWSYRYRLLFSVICAVAAAALWSVNLTAIYPVLKILGSDQNLQEWIDTQIATTERQIDELEAKQRPLVEELDRLRQLPDEKRSPTRERHLSREIAQISGQVEPARRQLYYSHVARRYIYLLFPTDRFQTLVMVIGLVVLGVAIKGFFEFWQEFLVGSVAGLSLYDLRNRFYRNVLHLDVNRFGKNGSPEIMSRFTNDMEMLGTGMKTLFGQMVAEPLRAVACVVVACFISWQLTLMFLVLVPIGLLILTKVTRAMKRATRRLLERMSNIYRLLQESFRGIRVVKAFTMESYERRRFSAATKEYYRKAMWVVTLDAMASPIIELLGVVGIAGALLVGAYLVLSGETSVGWLGLLNQPMEAEALIQLYVLLAAIAEPVRRLSKVYTRLQSGAAAADRIYAYFDMQPRVRANSDGPRLQRHSHSIEFRDVCFSYADPSEPALTNINLKIHHGETIALVGKNGSGKSTLVGLLPRFYDPDHGAIFIDGVNIREANLRSLRQQIGIVTQDTVLFEDDTIYNNIAYGNRAASRQEVEEAARRALLHELMQQKEHGYETRAGEASGGEKQRIALARAILRDPSILILDEFTSQTDTVSESDIHRILREFMKGRTTFVITHRLNTLEIADRIVVLDRGRIEAVGTHKELLAACRVYQSLHEAQFQRMVA